MMEEIGKNMSERIIQLEWNSVNLKHEFVKLRANQTKKYEVWSVKLSIQVLQIRDTKSDSALEILPEEDLSWVIEKDKN